MWTDQLFTGQRAMLDLGVYHYGARFYSPALGRFLSADTVVPGVAQSQAYDRYAYVRNNPVRYTDPTGHRDCEECGRDNLHDPVYAKNYDYVYYGLHTSEERESNTQKAETVLAAVEFGISIVSNTADIAFTATHCIMGDCGYATLIFAALPILPAGLGKYTDEVVQQGGKWLTNVVRNSNIPIVIGENMDRVTQYANEIGAEIIRDFIPSADWTLDVNKKWMQQMVKEGRLIIDIGPDFIRRSNEFDKGKYYIRMGYNIEREITNGYTNHHKVFQRIEKWKGGLPGEY